MSQPEERFPNEFLQDFKEGFAPIAKGLREYFNEHPDEVSPEIEAAIQNVEQSLRNLEGGGKK